MITKEEYEKAEAITKIYENQCSKCGKQLNNRRNSFEIVIRTEGDDQRINLFGNKTTEHPAIEFTYDMPGRAGGIKIEIGRTHSYQLCGHCHKELTRLIGNFILIKNE